MTHDHHSPFDAKVLLRGIHLGLPPEAKALIVTKAERLLRHEPRLLRVRIDVRRAARGRGASFTATGRIEIAGPDLTASVKSDAPVAAAALLIDKLDRMLRRRATHVTRRRTSDDIRAHVAALASA